MKSQLAKNIKIVTLGFALAFVLGSVSAGTFSFPTATPTGGNVALPLNPSANDQIKNGGLTVNGFTAFQDANLAQMTFINGGSISGAKIVSNTLSPDTLKIGDTTNTVAMNVNGTTTATGSITASNVAKATNDGSSSTLCSDASNKIVLCGHPTSSTIPTVSLSASSTTIVSGTSATLTWSSSYVTSCTGGWFSGTATSDATGVAVSPTTATSYTINCTGPYGPATDTVAINVTAATGVRTLIKVFAVEINPAPPILYTVTSSVDPLCSGGGTNGFAYIDSSYITVINNGGSIAGAYLYAAKTGNSPFLPTGATISSGGGSGYSNGHNQYAIQVRVPNSIVLIGAPGATAALYVYGYNPYYGQVFGPGSANYGLSGQVAGPLGMCN